MFATYAEKLVGLFDRRFLLAYWAPVVVSSALAGFVFAAYVDLPTVVAGLAALNVASQLVLGFGLLIVSIVAGFLLEALTSPIVRFYEGYNWPRWAADWGTEHQRKHWDYISAELSAGVTDHYQEFYFRFPRDREDVLPTRLGNILRAAEDYAYQVYFMDSMIWWPRLATLLPDTFTARIDAAITPMYALLNLASLMSAVALAGGVIVVWLGDRIDLFVFTFVGGLLLARLCYYAALGPAGGYGNLVRVAFDFYRADILKQMRIELPPDRVHERLLWKHLTDRQFGYNARANLAWPPELTKASRRFRFKDTDALRESPNLELMEITIEGLPKINVRRERVTNA